MIYLDHNATTQPTPEVVGAMNEVLTDAWHNPSSIHRAGQTARRKVELARRRVAELIGTRQANITFTSCGTEAIDLAIRGSIHSTRRRLAVTSPVEHSAVEKLIKALQFVEGIGVRMVDVDSAGVVKLDSLENALRDGPDGPPAVCSIQWANNETGAIQPVDQIGQMCRERGVVFHCDGTQWVGKMPTDVSPIGNARNIDILTFSAHKFHGPKGIGALHADKPVLLVPDIFGAQERGRRGGTENVPGIIGMGVAAMQARQWLATPKGRNRQAATLGRFVQLLRAGVGDLVINGPECTGDLPGQRLWNTANLAFPGLDAEALLLMLSERGLCASAGSACSSGSMQASAVLLAMGMEVSLAEASIRFSICRQTTLDEVERGAAMIVEAVNCLRNTKVVVPTRSSLPSGT